MMQMIRRSTKVAALPGLILALLAAPTLASETARGGNVQISPVEWQSPRSAPDLPRGMRTYGKRALRIETSGMAEIGSGETTIAGGATTAGRAAAPVKISGATMVGGLSAFAISPNGATVVFIADKDTAGRFELYSAPVDGSADPINLSTGLPFGSGDEGVSGFQISPDGSQVLFLADANHGAGVDDIFSVAIDGASAAVQLNDGAAAPVSAFGLSPDGTHAAFLGIDSVFGNGGVELYRASVGVAFSSAQISDAGSSNASGDVIFTDFSPDSTQLVYAADAGADGVFQWFSVAVAATGPGSDVELSSALSFINLVAISPDSATVVYSGDDDALGVLEVFAIPIGGGTAIKLNPSMAGSGISAIEISPDGSRVAYLADQDTAEVVEVYGALLGVAASGTRLSTPMTGTQFADTLNISPDSTTVLYEADQTTPGTYELFGVPIDASAGPSTLHGLTPPDNAGYFTGLGTPIIGMRAVYPVLGAAVDLFGVPFDGSESYTRINDALGSGDTILNAFVPTYAERLMAYGVGPDGGTSVRSIYAAPIRSDLSPEQINVTAADGTLGAMGFEIAAGQDYAVYVQDQETTGKLELFSAALDSDADTLINGADNCPFAANLSQDPVTFGQTVFATDHTTFAWGSPTEVRFVRGPLELVGTLATDDSGTVIDRSSYSDSASPSAGSGFYYLFAVDCPGRSYQTELGEEPDRDLAAFP